MPTRREITYLVRLIRQLQLQSIVIKLFGIEVVLRAGFLSDSRQRMVAHFSSHECDSRTQWKRNSFHFHRMNGEVRGIIRIAKKKSQYTIVLCSLHQHYVSVFSHMTAYFLLVILCSFVLYWMWNNAFLSVTLPNAQLLTTHINSISHLSPFYFHVLEHQVHIFL